MGPRASSSGEDCARRKIIKPSLRILRNKGDIHELAYCGFTSSSEITYDMTLGSSAVARMEREWGRSPFNHEAITESI